MNKKFKIKCYFHRLVLLLLLRLFQIHTVLFCNCCYSTWDILYTSGADPTTNFTHSKYTNYERRVCALIICVTLFWEVFEHEQTTKINLIFILKKTMFTWFFISFQLFFVVQFIGIQFKSVCRNDFLYSFMDLFAFHFAIIK